MEKTLDKKNVIWNMIGSTFNAFSSLFFTITVTRINGEEQAGIFIYCFATSCLFYFIANYCGRTFQVTDITKQNSDTDYIYNRLITCTVMLLISIGFCVVKKYDLFKSSILIILCVCRVIESIIDSFFGVIQKKGELYRVGISVFLKSLISFLILLIVDLTTKNLVLSCLSIIVVYVIIAIAYDYKNVKYVGIEKTKFSKEANMRIFKTGFFTFILTFLASYLVNAPRYAIDDLLSDNLQTIFGIIIMPATFMALLGQYIIQPSLTSISSCLENKNYKKLKRIIQNIILILGGLGILVFIVAWFLEQPVLQLVYGIDLKPYFTSMMIIIGGSIFYGFNMILSAILVAMRKTFIQVITYGLTAVISFFAAQILVEKFAMLGASIAYTLTMFIVATVYFVVTIISIKKFEKEWIKNEDINNNSNI